MISAWCWVMQDCTAMTIRAEHYGNSPRLALIQGFEYELLGGQQQLLLRASDRDGISGIPQKAVDNLFALLREDGVA
jgi:hypothetical protein